MRRPTTCSSRVAETDSQRSGPRLVPSLCLGLRGPEVETHASRRRTRWAHCLNPTSNPRTILLCGKCSTTMQIRTPFQDSDFAGDLEDSKSTSGGLLCIFGSQTFVPICWMCKKQTSVSHS